MPRELTWIPEPTAEPTSEEEWHVGWRQTDEWRTRKLLVLDDREGRAMLWAGPFLRSEQLPAPPEPSTGLQLFGKEEPSED